MQPNKFFSQFWRGQRMGRARQTCTDGGSVTTGVNPPAKMKTMFAMKCFRTRTSTTPRES